MSKFNVQPVTIAKTPNKVSTEWNTAFKTEDSFPLNFNPEVATVFTFFTCTFTQKGKCNYLWYLTCSSTLPGLPGSAGRSVSIDWGHKDERHLLHLLRGSSMDNLYKIYVLNNKWTKHLEVIGCVKLHNRPDSLSEQSKIRLNNEWGVQRISSHTNTAWFFKSESSW